MSCLDLHAAVVVGQDDPAFINGDDEGGGECGTQGAGANRSISRGHGVEVDLEAGSGDGDGARRGHDVEAFTMVDAIEHATGLLIDSGGAVVFHGP